MEAVRQAELPVELMEVAEVGEITLLEAMHQAVRVVLEEMEPHRQSQVAPLLTAAVEVAVAPVQVVVRGVLEVVVRAALHQAPMEPPIPEAVVGEPVREVEMKSQAQVEAVLSFFRTRQERSPML